MSIMGNATLDFIINGCPKLKTLSLGSHSLAHSNLVIFEGNLEDLSKGCKDLKDLKITNAKVWWSNRYGSYTEDKVKEMFPNCNVEIKECEFIQRCDCERLLKISDCSNCRTEKK